MDKIEQCVTDVVAIANGARDHEQAKARIKELLDDGVARLSNGWLVRLANTVDRSCPQETSSLSEFIRRFGPGSTTVIDLSKQRITMVRCSPLVKDNN